MPKDATAAKIKPVPQDHKDKVSDLDDYVFECADGSSITLPPFASVKPGVVRKTRKLAPVDQFFTTLEMLVSEDILEKIDDMSADEFGELQEGWFKHSGVDLGE